jgi:hypothetical protein
MSNSNSWVQMMSNPQGHVIKKYMAEILKDKFPPHQEILERIASTLITDGDLKSFGNLVSDIYQIGYLKAIKEHEDLLAKIGYKTKFITPVENTIFPQEKSG